MSDAMNVDRAMAEQFGPDWRRDPPLGEASVTTFEREHGIALPPDYRQFVVSVANGASGPPFYGLVGLGEPSDVTGGHEVGPGSLRAPFPLTEDWIWEGEPDRDQARFDAVHRDGILPLGTDGCAMDYVLVVSGPARGQVWMVADVGATAIAPDFSSWLEGHVVPGAEWSLEGRARSAGAAPPSAFRPSGARDIR